ncbi:MAG: S8 family serine peptidase [Acidobacteria bacterium]|nr:S8 family serine peptidase [Acidobacteriota bacterium]
MKERRRTKIAPGRPKHRGFRPLPFFALALALAGVAAAAAAGAFTPRAAARAAQDEAADGQISAAALKQIQALVLDKMSRTPAQRKIDSQLLYATKMSRGESIAPGVQSVALAVDEVSAGRVVVDITAKLDDAFFETLSANGARVLVAVPGYDSARVEVGLDRLEAIAALPQVRYIQSKQEAYTTRPAAPAPAPETLDVPLAASRRPGGFESRAARVRANLSSALAALGSAGSAKPPADASVGARTSQGDVTHRANVARSRYGVDGTGIKIGVLSDGVVNMASAVGTGDLPPDVTVLPGQVGSGDEGTAMLEIVHDLAPGAKLYFATAFSSITSFADNIHKLRAAGCDIIVDDIFYYTEAVFQDGQATSIVSNTNGGVVTQAVNDVTTGGALYFSSAGNEGNKNDGTAGVFEGDFADGGTLAAIGGAGAGHVHDFDTSAAVSQFDRITFGSGNPISCTWADPLGGSSNDYDLYVLNSAGTSVVALSTNTQDGTQDPIELVGGGANVTNNRIVVAKFSGADRYLHVNSFRGTLQFSTPGQTHGHASAALAYAVAATPSSGPFTTASGVTGTTGPYPGPHNSSNQVEPFESDGPRRLFFNANGAPYTAGNFSSTGGVVRQKPDITASDGGVVSGAGGFSSPFYGTSAAAPHAAAIAALVLSGKPGITPTQVRAALVASAIDIEAPGVDRDSGAGIIMADTALAAAGAQPVEVELGTVTATESAGNGNGFVEPGERGSLTVELRNNTGATLTGVNATLTSSTPGVTIVPPGTSAYPNIAAGGTATNTTPFQFIVSHTVQSPSTISFTLTVNYSGGTMSPRVLNFTLDLRRTATISTTLDTTAPPGGEGFTGTTGLQSGRIARTGFGTNSSCGINKPQPGVNAADQGVAHRYDAYTFQNNSNQTICVTITLTTSSADALKLQSVAYAPTFNPAAVTDNYLGDIANNSAGVTSRTYSVNVPANTSFVVVVNEVTGGAGVGTAYTLTVDGLPVFTAVPSLVSLQFQQATTQVQEDCTGFDVTVTRTGDTSFPVTVDYTTVDGTASSRSDYTKAIGTITFAAGQTSATIPVLISEDSYVEGTEAFTIALSNPQGLEVGVGTTGVTTVQILDDATEPAANPIDDSDIFVRQHYHDFLNREADASGLAFWKSQIDACGGAAACVADRRVQVSAAFFLSIEFQQTGYLVHRFYQEAYGRRIGSTVPLTLDEFLRDTQRIGRGVIVGQGAWQAALETNKQAYALEFVQRPEFLAAYPRSMNAAQFVDTLNTNTGGALSTAERNALVAQLAADNTDNGRASVLRQVADDADFVSSEFNRAFVLAEYFGYLRRNPNDPPDGNFNGYNFWLNKLNSFNGDFNKAEMVKAFITSTEYRQRFGSN